MKCPLCGADVPVFGNVLWCDDCIDEYLTTNHGLTMDQFIAKKRQEASRDAGDTSPRGRS